MGIGTEGKGGSTAAVPRCDSRESAASAASSAGRRRRSGGRRPARSGCRRQRKWRRCPAPHHAAPPRPAPHRTASPRHAPPYPVRGRDALRGAPQANAERREERLREEAYEARLTAAGADTAWEPRRSQSEALTLTLTLNLTLTLTLTVALTLTLTLTQTVTVTLTLTLTSCSST